MKRTFRVKWGNFLFCDGLFLQEDIPIAEMEDIAKEAEPQVQKALESLPSGAICWVQHLHPVPREALPENYDSSGIYPPSALKPSHQQYAAAWACCGEVEARIASINDPTINGLCLAVKKV